MQDKLMTVDAANNRFSKYFASVHNCTSQYTGNNLKSCLENIVQEQKELTQKLTQLKAERQRQALEMERIRQMQIMNANMQYQNQLIRQQNYQLSRPRYTESTTTTPYGNTYRTHTSSY